MTGASPFIDKTERKRKTPAGPARLMPPPIGGGSFIGMLARGKEDARQDDQPANISRTFGAAMWAWLQHPLLEIGGWIANHVAASLLSNLPGIVILTPQENETVRHRRFVRGTVTRIGEVQVYVWSPDRLWYRPPRPEYDGIAWRCECYFGNEASRPGQRFRVVAMDGGAPLAQTIGELPPGLVKSKVVTVTRGA
jgi:hypothetical protein